MMVVGVLQGVLFGSETRLICRVWICAVATVSRGAVARRVLVKDVGLAELDGVDPVPSRSGPRPG